MSIALYACVIALSHVCTVKATGLSCPSKETPSPLNKRTRKGFMYDNA